MRAGYALFFLASRFAREANAEDIVANTIEDTIFNVINTGLSAIDVAPVNVADYDSGKCSISSSVTCEETSTGENCENLIIPIDECGTKAMTFTFKFCNNEEDNILKLFKAKTEALVEMTGIEELNNDNLPPKSCREVSVVKEINTCKRFFSSSLRVEGKRGPNTDGSDYCYAWDFLRIFVRRGPCEITSDVASCKVDRTGEACEDFIVPQDECKLDEPMTFTYEYCNNEETPLKFRKQETIVLVEMRDIEGLDLSNLPSGECRTFSATQPINTCKRFYSTSLKVEGWRGDGDADYCYAYDFERIYTERPSGGPQTPDDKTCEISSKVTCTVPSTGENCDDIVVPYDDCQEDLEMIFEFEMCNYEKNQNAFLLGGQKTIALVEMVPVEGLDTSILSPGECRRFRESRKISTCKRFFSASLKVEGRRGDVFNDYCYAYDFYRHYIERPSDAPGDEAECDITANMKCTVDETGEDCSDIVVPTENCETDVGMTFTFEFCNRESTNNVTFFKDTRATIQNISIPDFNFNDLKPLECRRQIIPRQIDTCKRFFSSELLLEAKRGTQDDGSDYCFAYDFYRNYVTRFEKPTSGSTPNPALSPSIDNDCAITARITCTVDTTGQDCEDFVVPLDECDVYFPMTFEFEWCNFEVSQELDFFEDRAKALVELVPVDRLNLSNLGPGECRRRIETREINTCKRFFSTSLQIEAKKGIETDGSDYCYAYDFNRVFFKREDGTRAPTPVNEPTPANVPTPANEPTPANVPTPANEPTPANVPTPANEPTPANVPTPAQGTCDFSSAISCTVDETGGSCDEYEISRQECRDVDMTFVFEYCNLDPNKVVGLKDDLTIALIELEDVELDRSDMDPLECRTVSETRQINTCKNFFSASLKLEGKRGPKVDGSDYCYGWNFYRGYLNRPPPDDEVCNISAEITCTQEQTGESCGNMIISQDECNVAEPVIFDFVYCNEEDETVILNSDKTVATIDNVPIPSMDKSDLPKGCRSLEVESNVNTCNRFFSAELKVRGTRDGFAGLCVGYDHYRNFIERPSPIPSPVPSAYPSSHPGGSNIPTVEPTSCIISDPERRAARIASVIDTISDPDTFADVNSPQSRAKRWLIEEDTYDIFCGKPCSRSGTDGGVFQRYSLAVFYFSTNGDSDWFTCGRNSQEACQPNLTNFNQDGVPQISDNQNWLSSVNECAWGGLACRAETECLDRIEFGTYRCFF